MASVDDEQYYLPEITTAANTDRTSATTHPAELTQDQKLAQQAAEFLMAVATSPNPHIAVFSSAAYCAAETAFSSLLRIAYPGLTTAQQARIRALLAFYGPHDSLTDTYSYGVKSYVEYTRNPANASQRDF